MAAPLPWHLSWRTVQVQGRTAHYGEAGEGPVFVFLHGWGLGDKSYKRALNRIAKLGLRVIAPSLPGFGGTADLPQENFSIAGYARWVVDFLDAIGVREPVYLAGHSFGGGVSIRATYDHPDRVRLLVLVNSVGGSVWKSDQVSAEEQQLAERPLWDWGLHFPADVAKPREFRRVLPVVLEDVVRNVVRNPLAFWRVAQLARTADLREELEQLKANGMPVVVLWGHADKILPTASLEALATALGSEPDVVEGSHGWLLADPDAFGEVMTNVIAVAEYARRIEEREAAANAPIDSGTVEGTGATGTEGSSQL